MRAASLLEGMTLVLLVGIAVPLKHLADFPVAVRIMGPVHGLAFTLYVWMLVQTLASGRWTRAEAVRMLAVAFIPFGAFANERLLARRQRALASSV
ncbi:DUF3817 domain-containing protein [Gluconacetobacter asukensis]|uniref:DUF3817 domain-containing protein n=3 Tax=Acetobacteraceae TaxID=433 RepID=A0A7W4J8M7_9PROT|nr:DUF3817 domain-containing protein [Gluconacetobacter asukensis]MBB2176573.1 DUF3817 domain-containing protein [Gluconacetobacter johannae]